MTTSTTMHGDLRATLEELVRGGSTANPAFTTLIDDYARYHRVLAMVGGAFLVAFAALGCFSWTRYQRSRRAAPKRWTFATATYLGAVALSIGIGLALALIVMANVSTALDPRPGFAGTVPLTTTAPPGTSRAEIQQAFDVWLQTGTPQPPELVQRAVDDRLAWQRPKAIISGVLLVVAVTLTARTWRKLLAAADHQRRRSLRELVRFATGLGSIVVCLVLMLMVMGNTQASMAPLAITLAYG